MSLPDAAMRVTALWVVLGGVALVLYAWLIVPGYDFFRFVWRYYRKQRGYGYSRRDALEMAFDFI